MNFPAKNNKVTDLNELSFVESLAIRKENSTNEFKKVENLLKIFYEEKMQTNRDEEKTLKWKYSAIVMDRLFLYLPFIYLIFTFCLCVLSNKNLYQS